VAGFCSFEDRETQTLENLLHRQRMYKLLTGEVSAAVKGAKDAVRIRFTSMTTTARLTIYFLKSLKAAVRFFTAGEGILPEGFCFLIEVYTTPRPAAPF
jgi:hypothetical protein